MCIVIYPYARNRSALGLLLDLRSMFSAMRKRQSEEPPARENEQHKKICTATYDLPGTSFQIEDDESSLDGDNRDSSEEDLSDEEPLGPIVEREEYIKPPGPDDISQTPSDGPTQPKISYPARHQDHKRAFQAAWYQVHPRLEYSQSSDAAFCFACRHFLDQNIHAEETFTSGGFYNWKKAQGKKGKFAKHHAADYHVNAMVTWSSFKASQKLLCDQHKKEVRENRHFIKTVGEILLVTGMQNIAQRGHREDATSDNVGNLKRLLRLVSGHDDIIRKRLEEDPRNAKYTSPEIQNEMLATLALMVRDEILPEMLEAEQFSILVDETRDDRKTEQLSLVGRYFHGGKIKESFPCFKDTDGLDAASLCETIIQLLGGYGLDYRKNVVGQGYDGAAVMSGALSGVAKRVQEIAPSAEYVHC
ncbi:zinc finger MYM-type protein 1-like [Apostichopus japonicus]|uniref:zinc finger MYM-type protein 1-like n=1 Tax=Stichopus japonicus TaxID=307972 RepID=UPI003AB4F970